jgi:putative flippase GtrA
MPERSERGRLIRYAVVGASSGAVTLSLFAIGLELGIWYPVAAAIGYAAGIANGYTWNRLWTFQTGPFHGPQFLRYLIVSVCGLIANALGVLVGVGGLGWSEFAAEIAALVPIVLATYAANRLWIFRPRQTAEPG